MLKHRPRMIYDTIFNGRIIMTKPIEELTDDAYDKAIIEIAKSYLVLIKCPKCLHPSVSGYCCFFCGYDFS